MEENFEKELIIQLLTNDYKQLELTDVKEKLKLYIANYDNTYKLEISKQINLTKEEFLTIQKEITKMYNEMEQEKIEWPNSKIEYPSRKKIWEISYQDNENHYKKEGTITYPENWKTLIERITKEYI